MLIDCDDCVRQRSDDCGDCIVTFLIERPPGAIIFDVAEERALRNLQQVGLAPESRFEPRTASGGP